MLARNYISRRRASSFLVKLHITLFFVVALTHPVIKTKHWEDGVSWHPDYVKVDHPSTYAQGYGLHSGLSFNVKVINTGTREVLLH